MIGPAEDDDRSSASSVSSSEFARELSERVARDYRLHSQLWPARAPADGGLRELEVDILDVGAAPEFAGYEDPLWREGSPRSSDAGEGVEACLLHRVKVAVYFLYFLLGVMIGAAAMFVVARA